MKALLHTEYLFFLVSWIQYLVLLQKILITSYLQFLKFLIQFASLSVFHNENYKENQSWVHELLCRLLVNVRCSRREPLQWSGYQCQYPQDSFKILDGRWTTGVDSESPYNIYVSMNTTHRGRGAGISLHRLILNFYIF